MSLFVGAGSLLAQQAATHQPNDAQTAQLVTQLVPRFHLHHPKIDDEASVKIFDGFLKLLDQGKMYFLKSDIDSFTPHRLTLDDEIKAGDVQFAYTVFDTFKQRLGDQLKKAHALIDQEQDYSVDESMITDSKVLDWAATQEELDDRWRKRVKFDMLQYKLDDEPIEKAREKLHKRYRNIGRVIDQTTPDEKLEMYLTSMTHGVRSALDLHVAPQLAGLRDPAEAQPGWHRRRAAVG